MAVMVYKDGQWARIEHTEIDAYLGAGWGLDEDHVSGVAKPEAVSASADLNASDDLERARLAYAEKFGEHPHHRMKLETINEKLNGNESV